VLDLKRPEWRQIDRSCVAALSPDGATVALVRSNTEVWERPVDGGSASLVVDAAKLPEIRRAHLGGRLIVTRLAWGEGGLAVAVGSEQELEGRGGRNMIVTRDPSGRLGVVPLPPQAWDVPSRPWQPKGRLLALIGRPSSGGAIVRLFDPTTGKVSVVAADTQYFGNVAWSPDGRLLAANTSTNALLFFDTRGNWVKRAGLGGVGLLDWGP
jgi:hypothetical protein